MINTSFSKGDFTAYIKPFAQKMKERLISNGQNERAEQFQKGLTAFVKKVMGDFTNYEFYTGTSESLEGSIVLSFWEDESATGPIFYFFKDALKEIKC